MIVGGKISPHMAMVRTTATCFFSQPDVLTVTDLEPFFAKDLLGTLSTKTGAREYFSIVKNLAQIS